VLLDWICFFQQDFQRANYCSFGVMVQGRLVDHAGCVGKHVFRNPSANNQGKDSRGEVAHDHASDSAKPCVGQQINESKSWRRRMHDCWSS
jgi:hypothetical protein